VKTHTYWENRYASNGSSGSDPDIRHWIWRIIDRYMDSMSLEEVVDVGCGDLAFWEGRTCDDYVGVDVSPTIINQNKAKRPGWRFIQSPAEAHINGIKKECVLCMGVLFHIMEEEAFTKILQNLCKYSTRYIFVRTWHKNPFTRIQTLKRLNLPRLKFLIKPNDNDGVYQYYRPLENYLEIFRDQGFHSSERHEYKDGINALYMFKKHAGRLKNLNA